MPIHSVARMPSFSFLHLLHWPINHQPFTSDNGLNTWAHSLYVIHEQALWFPALDKNTLHISEMLQLQKVPKCTNVQSLFCSTIHWNFPNIGQMRYRWMSPKFAHSRESVYLFPISHSNKFHNFLYYDINLHDSAQPGCHCERIGSHCAWLGYEIGGSRHCDWLICHCAWLVSQRIMKSARIFGWIHSSYNWWHCNNGGLHVFCKVHAQHSLITASIHAASWLLVAMFDAPSSSLSKVQARSMATYMPSTMCKTKPTSTIWIGWHNECIHRIDIVRVIMIYPWRIIGRQIQWNCQD